MNNLSLDDPSNESLAGRKTSKKKILCLFHVSRKKHIDNPCSDNPHSYCLIFTGQRHYNGCIIEKAVISQTIIISNFCRGKQWPTIQFPKTAADDHTR